MLCDEIINQMDVDELRNYVHHLHDLFKAHGKANFAWEAEHDTLIQLYRDTEFRTTAVRNLKAIENSTELVRMAMRKKYLRHEKCAENPGLYAEKCAEKETTDGRDKENSNYS